jgi:hypothetical protein
MGLAGKPEGKSQLGRLGVDGTSSRHGLDLYGSVYGQVAGFCECGNEPLRLI